MNKIVIVTIIILVVIILAGIAYYVLIKHSDTETKPTPTPVKEAPEPEKPSPFIFTKMDNGLALQCPTTGRKYIIDREMARETTRTDLTYTPDSRVCNLGILNEGMPYLFGGKDNGKIYHCPNDGGLHLIENDRARHIQTWATFERMDPEKNLVNDLRVCNIPDMHKGPPIY